MNSPEARLGGKFAPTDAVPFLAGSAGFRDLWLSGKSTVDGKRAGAFNHNDKSNGDSEEVVFVAFTLLRAQPVGKETEMPVDHRDGHHHIAGDAERGDAAEESDEQPDAAKEFGADSQKREDVRLLSEKAHSACEAVATEPAKSLLSTMGKKNDTEDQAKNGDGEIVGSVHQPAEHEHASLSLVEKMEPQETEMLHRFRLIEDAKAANGGIAGVFEIEKIFERDFFEARGGEG
jgi:hypothetical protein